MLPQVEQYQVIDIGLPQAACRLQDCWQRVPRYRDFAARWPRTSRAGWVQSMRRTFLQARSGRPRSGGGRCILRFSSESAPFWGDNKSAGFSSASSLVSGRGKNRPNNLRGVSPSPATLESTCRLGGGCSLRSVYHADRSTLDRMRDHLEHTFRRRQTDRHVRNTEVLVKAPKDR